MTDRHEMYFVLALFGEELTINMGGPHLDGYHEWLKQNDGASPLYHGKNEDPLHECVPMPAPMNTPPVTGNGPVSYRPQTRRQSASGHTHGAVEQID